MKNKIIFAISCTLFFAFSSSILAKTPPKKVKPFVELIKEIPVLTFPLSIDPRKEDNSIRVMDAIMMSGGTPDKLNQQIKHINTAYLKNKELSEYIDMGTFFWYGKYHVTKDLLVLVYMTRYPWGAGVDHYVLATFKPDGTKIDEKNIGYIGGEESVVDYTVSKIDIDLMIAIQKITDYDPGEIDSKKKDIISPWKRFQIDKETGKILKKVKK